MTCATASLPDCAPARAAAAAPAAPAAEPTAPRLALLASVSISYLAGSSAPTALYPVYQAQWGFSAATVTAVFATYVVVLLAALLVFGRLSDHLGRKPVILATLGLQLAAMAVFALAQDVAALFAARVLQGLGTGAALAAVGAGLLDLDRSRGTLANAVTPALGTALGGFAGGLVVRFLPAPTHLVYALLAAVYVLQALAVARMREPGQPRPGALPSLRPQLAAPRAAWAALRVAAPLMVAGWAVPGFFASLGPGLLHRVFGFDASLAGGLALFVLASSAAGAVLLLRDWQPERLVRTGALALATGTGGLLSAIALHLPLGFGVAAVVAGAGFGAGFQGGMRSVMASASAADRAGLLSLLFLISYLALGLPAVLAGMLVVRTGDVVGVALGFGGAVLALALLALRGSSAGAGMRMLE